MVFESYLEVDDDKDDQAGGKELRNVWCILSVECLLQGVELVLLSNQEMEESNDGAFKFGSLLCSDCDWRERLPQDDFANVSGNEQGDTTAETVSLLQELVKKDDDDASGGELHNNQDGVDVAKFSDGAVHAR